MRHLRGDIYDPSRACTGARTSSRQEVACTSLCGSLRDETHDGLLGEEGKAQRVQRPQRSHGGRMGGTWGAHGGRMGAHGGDAFGLMGVWGLLEVTSTGVVVEGPNVRPLRDTANGDSFFDGGAVTVLEGTMRCGCCGFGARLAARWCELWRVLSADGIRAKGSRELMGQCVNAHTRDTTVMDTHKHTHT